MAATGPLGMMVKLTVPAHEDTDKVVGAREISASVKSVGRKDNERKKGEKGFYVIKASS